MRESEKRVGRADNTFDGERSTADDHPIDKAQPDEESADRRAHGAHGRGGGEEKVNEDTPSVPDEARGSDRGGSASWGSEGSGGSVTDKRPDR